MKKNGLNEERKAKRIRKIEKPIERKKTDAQGNL